MLIFAPYYAAPAPKMKGAIHLQDLCVETLVPASETLVIEVALADPKQIIAAGEPLDCRARVCNLAAERRLVKLRWQVADEAGTALTDEHEEVEVEGHATATQMVRLRLPGPGKHTAKFIAETERAQAVTTLALAR